VVWRERSWSRIDHSAASSLPCASSGEKVGRASEQAERAREEKAVKGKGGSAEEGMEAKGREQEGK